LHKKDHTFWLHNKQESKSATKSKHFLTLSTIGKNKKQTILHSLKKYLHFSNYFFLNGIL
jgi:hypothetical protein